jgi:hypothetical protein
MDSSRAIVRSGLSKKDCMVMRTKAKSSSEIGLYR